MTRLAVPLLLLGAIVVALWIVVRRRRSEPVVLRGPFARRFLRLVVVVLLVLGFLGGRARAQGDDSPAEGGAPLEPEAEEDSEALPDLVTKELATRWLRTFLRDSAWTSLTPLFRELAAGRPLSAARVEVARERIGPSLPPAVADLLFTEFGARSEGVVPLPADPRRLLSVIEEAEAEGIFRAFLVGAIWRRVPGAVGLDPEAERALVRLLSRLRRHARIRDVLVKAKAEVKPEALDPRPWMSKAARPPRPELTETLLDRDAKNLLEAAKRLYPETGPGTFERDGILRLAVPEGEAVRRIRGGRIETVAGTTRIARLDLLEVPEGPEPLAVRHSHYGQLTLPRGAILGVRDLPALLSEEGRLAVTRDVASAMVGDGAAAERLEDALALSAPSIRTALEEDPDAPGAPRLRLILALFDEIPPLR